MLTTKDNLTEEMLTLIADKVSDDKLTDNGIYDALDILAKHQIFKINNPEGLIKNIAKIMQNSKYQQTNATALMEIAVKMTHRIDPQIVKDIITNNNAMIGPLCKVIENVADKKELFDVLSTSKEALPILPDIFNSQCSAEIAFDIAMNNIKEKESMRLIKYVLIAYPNLSDEALMPVMTKILDNLPIHNAWLAIDPICDRPQFKMMLTEKLRDIFNVSVDEFEVNESIKRSKYNITGLKNLGATCYINSVFQSLFNIEEFRKKIFDLNPTEKWQKAMQELFYRMKFSKRKFEDTKYFCDNFTFFGAKIKPTEPQDAAEFLEELLDKLHESSDMFQGEITLKIEYKGEVVQETIEPFHLSMAVKNCKNFEQSFNAFLAKETIYNYESELLQKKVDVERHSIITKTPEYLIVHLKRFEFDYAHYTKNKINTPFDVPEYLDISPIAEGDDNKYKVVGAIMHMGDSESGHYKSLIAQEEGGFMINDRGCSLFPKKDVLPMMSGTANDFLFNAFKGLKIFEDVTKQLKQITK